MPYQLDFMFSQGAGYDDLLDRLQSNKRFVFFVHLADKIDKRTRKSKNKGWAKIEHKKYGGSIRLVKDSGRCRAEIRDDGTGEFTGAWMSWLIRNASDLIYGMNLQLAF